MTKAEAIEYLKQVDFITPQEQEARDMAIKALEKPSKKSAKKWIPCSEKLPETFRRVLIWTRSGYHVGWRENKRWTNDGVFIVAGEDEVFAWMPLPRRYRR